MSSSEDEDDDEIVLRVENMVAKYKAEYANNDAKGEPGIVQQQLQSREAIAQRLQEELRRQSHSCMICIERIKKLDPIWNCRSCRTPYHLPCIQRWARECSSRSFSRDDCSIDDRNEMMPWCCPKCRFEYRPNEIPFEYRCFCGKVMNPKSDPWLIPHSCGDVCRRALRCGHACLIICHPGLCPPCPKIVRSQCFCGKSPAQMRRCHDSTWSCQQTCNKTLSCGRHRCSLICHEGDCESCSEIFERNCLCGKNRAKRPCSEASWSCEAICGRLLNCNKHTCSKRCHSGICGSCTDDALTCPCGKTTYKEGNCIDDLKCCGDTCGKLLDCKFHKCVERCHRGPCGSCNQLRTKRCRCGLKEKEFACGKDLFCDVKCKRKRHCGRHACNRKCCDGDCPPCEQMCGKRLECGNHKCPQPCHRGPCFPCPLSADVKCLCGKTIIKVPCGHERKTRPPRCKNLCPIPPVCRHTAREEHRCHYGDCPPCRQVCNAVLKCGHKCQSLCHTGLLVDVNLKSAHKPSTPWEKPKPKFELVDVECPPCQQPVPMTCLGCHETCAFPCSEAKPYSCGRPCGRPLDCGNHKCPVLCHDIKTQPCQPCEERCSLPRPDGCTHSCSKFCHPAPCPSCRQMVRHSCHCSLNQKFIPCSEWSLANEEKRTELLSCGNQCPRPMPCGHRCTLLCHKGPCSASKTCSKRTAVCCPCGRRSVKGICSAVQSGDFQVACDEECEKQKAAAIAAKQTAMRDSTERSAGEVGGGQREPLGLSVRRRKKNRRRYEEDDDDGGEKSHWIRLKNSFLVRVGFILCVGIISLAILLSALGVL